MRAKNLAGGSGFRVILHSKLRAALGKGGSRCLFIAGSRSSAVTPAPLLLLCLAQTTRTGWTTRRRAGLLAVPPTRAARRAMIRVAARAERRSTRRARRCDDDRACRATAASRRDVAARAAAAEDAARGARRVDGRTKRPPRRVRGDRAFTAAVAHATTGGQTPRRSHSRACAVARLVGQCGLCCCCASLTAPRSTRRAQCVRRSQRRAAAHLRCHRRAGRRHSQARRAMTHQPLFHSATVWCGVSLGFSKGVGLSRRSSRSVTNPALGLLGNGAAPHCEIRKERGAHSATSPP